MGVQEIDFNLKFRHETPDTSVAASATNAHAPAEDTTNIQYALTVDASKYVFGSAQGVPTNNGIGQDDAGHSFSFTLRCLLSSLDGNGAFIANQGVATQTKDDITTPTRTSTSRTCGPLLHGRRNPLQLQNHHGRL